MAIAGVGVFTIRAASGALNERYNELGSRALEKDAIDKRKKDRVLTVLAEGCSGVVCPKIRYCPVIHDKERCFTSKKTIYMAICSKDFEDCPYDIAERFQTAIV